MSTAHQTGLAYERFLSATIESHPGHSPEWYEARVAQDLWFILNDGDMSGCPAQLPDELPLPVGQWRPNP